MFRIARAAALVLLLPSCVPERDNPHDTANAPVARLAIESTSGASVFAISRGSTVFLDAGESDDPQGADGLTYEFALVSTAGALAIACEQLGVLEPLGTGEADRVEVSESMRRRVPPHVAILFRVIVEDGSSAPSCATAAVVFENTAPTRPRVPPLVLPFGGFPFSPGTDFDAVFHTNEVLDPDGDPVEYCWRFPPANEQCAPAPTGLTFHLPVESAVARRITGVLRAVDDTGAESSPAVAIVAVGESPLWVAKDGASLEQLDTLRSIGEVDLIFGTDYPAMVALDKTHIATFGAGLAQGAALRVFELPSLAKVGDDVPTSWFTPAGLASDGERLWAFAPFESNAIYAWDWDGSTLTPVAPVAAPTPYLNRFAVTRAGTDRDAWMGQDRGDLLLHVHEDLSYDMVPIPAGRIVTGFDLRPESPELWTVETRPFEDLTSAAPARIVRYVASQQGVEEVGSIDLPMDFAFALTWGSPSDLWLSVDGEGLLLVDAEVLLATGELQLATVHQLPMETVFRLHRDDSSGNVWATGYGDAVYHATRDGGLATYGANGTEIFGVDPEGALWFTSASTYYIVRGASPSDDGVLHHVTTGSGAAGAAVDGSTGGVWIGSVPNSVPGLTLFAPNGTTARSVTRVVNAQGIVAPVPQLRHLSTSPDGKSMWAFAYDVPLSNEPTRLVYLRMDQDPPRIVDVITDALTLQGMDFNYDPLIAGNGGMTWGLDYEGFFAVITTDGTIDVRFTTPSDFGTANYAISRSRETNDLYLALKNGSTIEIWILPPAGTVVGPLTSMPSGVNNFAQWLVAGPSSIWLSRGYISDGTIEGFDLTGASLHPPITVTGGYVGSFAVPTNDEIWVVRRTPSDADRTRYDWDGVGWVPLDFGASGNHRFVH